MSQENLQKHFDQEPVKFLGRGSEVKVYGTSRAVIKVWDPRADIPTTKGLLYRAALPQIKAGMGGLVVPFEEVDQINAYEVQGTRWFRKEYPNLMTFIPL